jgi:hypothetical protein
MFPLSMSVRFGYVVLGISTLRLGLFSLLVCLSLCMYNWGVTENKLIVDLCCMMLNSFTFCFVSAYFSKINQF